MKKRRQFTPEYKAKIVMEALREEQTVSEIAAREGLNLNVLGNWRREFEDNAARAFSRSRDERDAAREMAAMKAKEKQYQAKVGQLTLEVDFLKGAHERVYGYKWDGELDVKR